MSDWRGFFPLKLLMGIVFTEFLNVAFYSKDKLTGINFSHHSFHENFFTFICIIPFLKILFIYF